MTWRAAGRYREPDEPRNSGGRRQPCSDAASIGSTASTIADFIPAPSEQVQPPRHLTSEVSNWETVVCRRECAHGAGAALQCETNDCIVRRSRQVRRESLNA